MWQVIALTFFFAAIAEARLWRKDKKACKKMIKSRNEQISALKMDLKYYVQWCKEEVAENNRLKKLLEDRESGGIDIEKRE